MLIRFECVVEYFRGFFIVMVKKYERHLTEHVIVILLRQD